MSGEPFLGEIGLFAGNFAPRGYAFCDGQLLPIAQNTALFALLGTFYGGNGRTTFALPDLRGRAPMGMGQGPGLSDRTIGEVTGSGSVTLTAAELPAHVHSVQADTTSDRTEPAGSVFGAGGTPRYVGGAPDSQLRADLVQAVGGSAPHENRAPYLAVSFIIALQGVFPPRS